ncbi:L-threonylcarbamoyladenylate synthase [Rubritalea tangerina]|uniref:Threonylcarbamoyl-AMP synthase n=1 Tax=Rubritalea tangerina TaxID=430798 RepID=A0ABW4ZD32_9BACT
METEILYADPEGFEDAVAAAVGKLDAGEVVALPTETVYGLGANALDEDAVAKVFEAKERPSFDPLIIHIAQRELIREVCELSPELDAVVQQLMQAFWPGPFTMVLPKKSVIPDIVTSGQETVAVRMSEHPVMRAICKELGKPIAAPSANRFGRISPTSAGAVEKELGGRIPLIIDGGACNAGLESTIVRVELGEKRPELHLLRAGPIVKEELQKIGKVIRPKKPKKIEEAPGQLESHYAPSTPLYLFEKPEDFEPDPSLSYGLLSYRGAAKDGYIDLYDWDVVEELSPGKGKLPEAAVRLFFALRQLDESGVDAIVAESVAETGIGVAINDRLRRASAKTRNA